MVTVSERPVVLTTADGPTVGLAAQFALLAAVSASVGLGPVGWLVGTAYALTVWICLGDAMRRAGTRTLGPANQVTLARATLVGGVAALAAEAVRGNAPVTVLVVLATVALILDGVDGQVARRTSSTSRLGARFDMEVDAALILILSVLVAGSLGAWVLAMGVLRYAFVAATWVLPWLRADLPARLSRKTVAAVQGIALVVAGSGFLPRAATVVVVGLALASLVWSFARDIAWLRRHRDGAGYPSHEVAASGAPAPSRSRPAALLSGSRSA
jgi:phosphatidylglycerophosphate synthase